MCGTAVDSVRSDCCGRRSAVGPRVAGRPGPAWAVGWAVTTLIGVAVGEQFTVFGSSGAVTVATLTSVLPLLLRTGRRAAAPPRSATANR